MNFTFLWFFLFPFIFLPFVIRYFQRPLPDQLGGQALCVPFFREVLRSSSNKKIGTATSHFHFLFWFAWLLFVLALMRPVLLGEAVFIPNKARQVMLVLDVSGSMAARDFTLNGRRMTRLAATKALAYDFIEKRQGDALGLIIFGADPYVYVPLTQDVKTAKELLSEVDFGIANPDGTAIGDALGLALKQMQNIPSDNKVIVFLSDGSANTGVLRPEDAVSLAKQMNTKIYTIGLGSDEQIENFGFFVRRVNPSADLDEEMLKTIANETGGTYFRVKTSEDLKAVYEKIDKMEPVDANGYFVRPQKDLFWIPLLGSVILFFVGFVLTKRLK